MLSRFFKTAWRHALKNPSITIIQIVGLTVGITVFLFIAMWINNQISYDRFNEKHQQIYRIEFYNSNYQGWTEQFPGVGPDINNNIAGVEDFVRIKYNIEMAGQTIKIVNNEEIEKEVVLDNFIQADTSFFRMFSFDFILGDPQTALDEPNSVVITKSIADKLFGRENPLGKVVRIFRDQDNIITGVIKDVNNFHLPFDAVRSFLSMEEYFIRQGIELDTWETAAWFPTYFLLNKNSDPELIAEQMTLYCQDRFASNNDDYENDPTFNVNLRPLRNIYFHGKTEREFNYVVHGNFTLITGLSLIALLILLLAILNFVNLNTSRTIMRSKEVGVRKMTGASRESIFNQFTGEVITLCIICLILSIALIQLLLPYFNNLVSSNLKFDELFNKYNITTVGVSILLIIVLAGAIPSFSLASFKPATVLRSINLRSSSRGFNIRRFLLVLQYSITIIVIAATFLVQKQTSFMKNSDPGFNMDNLFWTFGADLVREHSEAIYYRDKLLEHPAIQKASYTHTVPPYLEPSFGSYSYRGRTIPTHSAYVNPGFFDVLGVPLIAGRDFSFENPADSLDEQNTNNVPRYILNETAVKEFGIEEPIGAELIVNDRKAEIIGVVKDFHFMPMNKKVPPVLFNYEMRSRLLIKAYPGKMQEAIQYVRELVYEKLEISNLRTVIIEDEYYKDFKAEEQLGKLFIWFALISILIGALGLYGISTNAIQRRIKEIGIRKALGATAGSILGMLQLYFSKIVLISGLIAIPVSYYLLTKWLNGYPYKTDLSWWIFFGSLVFAVVIALATISYRTWKAARSNPVNALRYE